MRRASSRPRCRRPRAARRTRSTARPRASAHLDLGAAEAARGVEREGRIVGQPVPHERHQRKPAVDVQRPAAGGLRQRVPVLGDLVRVLVGRDPRQAHALDLVGFEREQFERQRRGLEQRERRGGRARGRVGALDLDQRDVALVRDAGDVRAFHRDVVSVHQRTLLQREARPHRDRDVEAGREVDRARRQHLRAKPRELRHGAVVQ